MKSLLLLNRFVTVALANGVLAACFLSSATAVDDSPGWSDTKPESGPSVEVDGRYLIPYVEQLPGKEVSFVMIPVPGGEFLMGSPEDEADRNEDEGPQVRVKVEPFWIGRNEVTWAEYQSFMEMYNAFKQLQALKMNRNQHEGDV